MLPRSRRFTRDFKIKVWREIEGGQRPFEVARKYEIHQRLISKWRKKFFEEGERAFAKGPTAGSESGTSGRVGTQDWPANHGDRFLKKSITAVRDSIAFQTQEGTSS